ncbi:bifunctional phosphopantothenoylcysteine decarboxylase/phosphopantothenate--cysteine ligase CoaBC [Thiolinea disciformis]|uniref:bifunctional phosphopantothenoylcysteine decarboxylase/phosphopantothenate--cysteine ligase CoaBC n=1 Tax=Thiolinea disciformis TaxID=125614 RepID=UPI00036B1200|nr:bifunctional phosphopantothenoylcysteine decarboxylase/phosphopantothenate--cysteine ligase CoaBC [Thiolinea disciformis]
MTALLGKRIVLGISGGIAAYKSAELTRLLIKAGAQVRVCMTPAACEFIQPLTFQALSSHPVHTTLLDTAAEAGMGHIELARWADMIVIAPATADLMARFAHGHADDLLTTLCLASAAPLYLAPAMNQQMWKHPATQANLQRLQSRGVAILGPDQGVQACGDVGMGRMLEPEAILAALQQPQLLSGIRILLTAGPTREAIDPVRFLTNRSSGKMGYAVAAAAQEFGASVTLISGPVALDTPLGVERIWVESAADMLEATRYAAGLNDIFIATAAVADYTPKQVATQKIKKNNDQLVLEMTRTTDILVTVVKENPKLFTVGFAAETQNLMEYARGKLERKGVHMIAANSVAEGKGFDRATNALEVVWQGGSQSLPEMDKKLLARALMAIISQRYQQWKGMQA